MPQYSQIFRHRDLGKQCLQTQITLSKQSARHRGLAKQLLTLRSSLIRVYTIYQSVCIFWMHYSMLKSCSNFMIYAFFQYPNVLDFYGAKRIWAVTWQNQQNGCASSEDSDQPGHSPSLIRVFAVRMKKAWFLSYPLSAWRRLWSNWVDAQADLSLHWAYSHFVGYVMSRLIYMQHGQETFNSLVPIILCM